LVKRDEDIDRRSGKRYTDGMKTVRYIYWQDGDMWLGHLEEYPDYMTQGQSVEELQENLKDLYAELTSGRIPGVRRVAEFRIA
jgi:hypothetical protein